MALLASMRAVREAIACTDRRRDVVAFGHVAAASTKPRAVIFLRQPHDEVVCIGNLRIRSLPARGHCQMPVGVQRYDSHCTHARSAREVRADEEQELGGPQSPTKPGRSRR